MPDIPEFRFVDAELEPGLERSPFLAWDVSAHVPHVADPRTHELRRLPHLDDTPQRFDASLSADGTTAITTHRRVTGDGIFMITSLRVAIPTVQQSLVDASPFSATDRVLRSFDMSSTMTLAAESRANRISSEEQLGLAAGQSATVIKLAEAEAQLEPSLVVPDHALAIGDDALTAAQLSPNSSRFAISVTPTEHTPKSSFASTLIVDVASGETLVEIPDLYLHGTRSWSPDGERLLVRGTTGVSVYDIQTHSLTAPLGLPEKFHLQPKTRVHRVQGWHDDEQVVTAFKDGPLNTFFAINLIDGRMTPLYSVRSRGATMFHISGDV